MISSAALAAALTYSHSPSGNIIVGAQANFVVQAPDSTGHDVLLSDGGAGGIFYSGTIGGSCDTALSGSTIRIASSDTQKAFCYSNTTPGTYTVTATTSSLDSVSTSITVVSGIVTIGSTTYNTVQAAINAAINGDTINIGAGTYAENISISDKTNITILGSGQDTTIIEPVNGTRSVGITITNSNNVSIKNLKIHTRGSESHGIWVYGAALNGGAMTGLTVQDTTINVDGLASGIIGDSSAAGVHSGWLIGGEGHGNTILINNTGNDGGDGLDFQDITNSEVSYNTITILHPGASTNVLWTSERYNLSNLIFSHNTISGSGGSEVSIITDYNQNPGSHTVPTEDPVVDTSIDGVTFSNNTFSNWGSRAIRVGNAYGTGTVTGITINSNTFQMTADTAQVIGGTAASVATGNGNIFNVSSPAKIQKAIDSAFTGDTINISAGTYSESVNVNKEVAISGAGKGSDTNVDTIISPTSGTSGLVITSNNVTIKDLRVVVDSSDGISIKAANNVTINNIDIEKTGGSGGGPGIFIYGTGSGSGSSTSASSNNLTIIKSTINVANENNGIYASNTTPAHSGWIIGGSSENANTISTGGTPLELHDVTNSTVSYNTITGVLGTSVIWESNLSDIANITFSNNTISGGQGSQVSFISDYFYSDPNSTPYPGDIINTSITGITIQGNTFNNWGTRALRIGMDNIGRVTGATINQNKFLKAGLAITNADTNASVDATNNYWGEASPDFTTKISTLGGTVNYTPWWMNSAMNLPSTLIDVFTGIHTTLETAGIANNIDTCATTPNSCTGLYFEKRTDINDPTTALGRITFNSTLDLTNSDTQTFLQNLGSKMDMSGVGVIGLDFRNTTNNVALKNVSATIKFYGLNNLGFNADSTASDINSKLVAYDDSGNVLDKTSLIPSDATPTYLGACEVLGGCYVFTIPVNHFTSYKIDNVPPVITISGSTPLDVAYGSTYTDAGATAIDNIDGNITSSIVKVINSGGTTVSNVDTSIVGASYTITYNVTDHAGNQAVEKGRVITIVKATPTITIIPYTGTYDGNTHGATGTATGVNNEDLSSLLALGSVYKDAPGSSTGWSFAGNNNYNSASGTTSVTINPKTITVTAEAKSKERGASDPTLTYTASSLIGTDAFSGSLTRDAGEAAGAYAITQGSLTAGNNYTINYVGANLTISDTTPPEVPTISTQQQQFVNTSSIAITGTAEPLSTIKIEGGTNTATGTTTPEGTYSVTVNLNLNTANTLYVTATDASNNTSEVNTIVITQDQIAPTVTMTDDHADYIVKQGNIVTFTATFDDTNGIIDTGTNAPRISINSTGIVNDALMSATGNNKVWTYTWTVPAGNDGSHTVSVKAYDQAGNMNQATGGKTSYTIDNTAPVITISGPASLSVTYGSTYTDAGATTDDGSAVETSGSVNTLVRGDYTITYTSTDTAGNQSTATRIVSVIKAEVTVTADAKTKVYGENDPVFTYTYTGLVNGENSNVFFGSLVRSSGEDVNTYAIEQGGLTTSNYNIAFTGANLTITPKSATVTANDKTKVYGEVNPTLTATVTGTVNGNTIDYTLGTTANQTTGVGNYDITVTPGTNPNYSVTTTKGTLTITIDPNASRTTIETISNGDGTKSGTITSDTTFSATIPGGSVSVEMEKDTVVTASGWDGVMYAPKVGTTTGSAPSGFSVGNNVIEIGSPDVTLTFDKAVKITLVGVTGNVGYRPAGSNTWTQITKECASATVPGISSGECYFHDGGNTIIWTYHFTAFAGLDVVRSSSGSYIKPLVVNTPTDDGCSSGAKFSTTTGKNCNASISAGEGKVLGTEKFNFTILIKKGSKGNEVIELQKLLTSLGYDVGIADGKFGPKTKAAVIKFQIANKLVGDGVVGTKTRAMLNK